MKIYLVRHGESVATGDDHERPLSAKGRSEIERLATVIAPLKFKISHLYCGTRIRAQQTAELLLPAVTVQAPLKTRAELSPLSPVDPMIDEINIDGGDTLLVGHMPFMGKMAGKLVTGDENNEVVVFSPGSMVCLERLAENKWTIRWVLSPEIFPVKV